MLAYSRDPLTDLPGRPEALSFLASIGDRRALAIASRAGC
jgi:hypothetical protein